MKPPDEDTSRRPEEMMFGLGPMELAIILGIVVILFGARRLPEIGAGVGKAIKNFKSGVSGEDEIDVTPEADPGSEKNSEGKPKA
jgi:sec-independent protein translocase protein TatA